MASKAIITPTGAPACYFPLKPDVYDIGPGLYKFGTDFGNGQHDQCLFQLDREFSHYRQNKIRARDENIKKYVCTEQLDKNIEQHLNLFMLKQLVDEHAQYFSPAEKNGETTLHCNHTGDRLCFEKNGAFAGAHTGLAPGYVDAWDAWGCQVQEDLALVQFNSKNSRTLALHLCAANHWAASEKLGMDFLEVHKPVPEFDDRYAFHSRLLHSLVHKGPYVRFAWGLATDKRLNHHPLAPAGTDEREWQGRSFNTAHPELFIRTERQCIRGMPEINSLLFTIRTSFLDISDLHPQKSRLLAIKTNIENMDSRLSGYKGLNKDRKAILEWLDNLQQQK